MIPVAAVVVLRSRRDLERTHVLGHVHAGQVEGARRDPLVAPGVARGREIPVPGLVAGSLERGIEAELDDLELWPQDRFRHRGDPRVRDEDPVKAIVFAQSPEPLQAVAATMRNDP